MSEEKTYNHPKIPEVLEAFKLLLNDSMSLDFCGVTGKDRKLILNDSEFVKETRQIKASKYIEEIKEMDSIIKSLNTAPQVNENARFAETEEDKTKIINMKIKLATMRRDMLSLTTTENENEESESLNIFFIDISREEFERMVNTEVHEGDEQARLIANEGKEAPMEKAMKRREQDKQKTSIPEELAENAIEYIDEQGDRVIEEVGA